MEEGLDRVDAGLTRVEDSLDRVEGGLTRVEHRLDRLESLVVHRTSLQFQMAREWNDRAVNTDCELMRLPHPDTGELPPLDSFPATRGHLMTLRVDALLTFYDLRPEENISLHERRDLLGRILGCR